MSHTPGPWRTIKMSSNIPKVPIWIIEGPGKCWIASDGVFAEEDANLIAAAPDLLAACKAVLPQLETYLYMTSECSNYQDEVEIKQLKEAIAKAEKPLDRSEEVK